MTYEEIWQKIKRMSQRDRKQLAYEMTLKGFKVGYIHPHYYFDAKAVHDILFYPPNSQHEIKDPPKPSLKRRGKSLREYYEALKEIMEDDKEIHIRVKRYTLLPRFINNWREGNIVKAYILSRIHESYVNAYYRILPGKSLAGEHPRSLFLWDGDGGEMVYKMTACTSKNGYEEMTFQRMEG